MMKLWSRSLSGKSLRIHNLAVKRARNYVEAEGLLLASLIEVAMDKTYAKCTYTYLTPYCEEELGLSEDTAATYVRIVNKSFHVPELAEAVMDGRIPLFTAKRICSVLTPENKEEW